MAQEFVRLEIDLAEETAERFGFLLRHLNALAVHDRADIWTPSELAASIIRAVVDGELRGNIRPIDDSSNTRVFRSVKLNGTRRPVSLSKHKRHFSGLGS